MNITGTIYIIDEPRIDVLKSNLMRMPPPGGNLAPNTALCMDMDETDNMLEVWFPEHCQKATILLPPPAAMYKEIDGDQEGFIKEYNEYLEYDSTVQDFICSMILYLHIGGNILLYTPSHLEDDTLWTNVLILFFFTRFGITIGSSIENSFAYDPKYDGVIADLLYGKGYISIMEYLNISDPTMLPSTDACQKLAADLSYIAPGEDPMAFYYDTKRRMIETNSPLLKPAIIFER